MGTVFRGGECQDRLDIETVQKEKKYQGESTSPALSTAFSPLANRTQKRRQEPHTLTTHDFYTLEQRKGNHQPCPQYRVLATGEQNTKEETRATMSQHTTQTSLESYQAGSPLEAELSNTN
jgi:hypothetical protein